MRVSGIRGAFSWDEHPEARHGGEIPLSRITRKREAFLATFPQPGRSPPRFDEAQGGASRELRPGTCRVRLAQGGRQQKARVAAID